jgi:hypothetical protein
METTFWVVWSVIMLALLLAALVVWGGPRK